MGLYDLVYGTSNPADDLEATQGGIGEKWDNFREGRREKSAELNDFLNSNLDYFLGPTGIPDKLRAINEVFNPVVGIGDAGTAIEDGRYLDAATDTAAAMLPVAATALAKPLIKGVSSAADEIADASTAIKETLLGGSFSPDRRQFIARTAALPAAAAMLPVMDDVAVSASKKIDDVFSPQALAKLSDEDFSQMLNNLDEKMYDGELGDELTAFFDNPSSMPEINNVLNEAQKRGKYEDSAFNTFLDYQLPDTSITMMDGSTPTPTNIVEEVSMPPASNSSFTQIPNTIETYKKADLILKDAGGEGPTLDFGAGLGMSKSELGYDTFEPFAKGTRSDQIDFTSAEDISDSSYKKIANLNVLNVVPKNVRDEIVLNIGRILQPDGTAIITTRGVTDVATAKNKVPLEDGYVITVNGKPRFQKGFTQSELKEYVQGLLGDGFEISNTSLGSAGIIVKKKSSNKLPATVASQTEDLFGGADFAEVAAQGDMRVPNSNPTFGPNGRISTRVPMVGTKKTGGERPDPAVYSGNLTIGKDVMDEAGTTEKNMELLASGREQSGDVNRKGVPIFDAKKNPNPYEGVGDVPYFPGFKALEGMSPEDRAKFVSAMQKENLSWIMNKLPKDFQDRAKLWYTGANRFSSELSDKYGVPRASVSGVIAALSPQKDWFQNASMAERVLDAAINNRTFPWSPEMTAIPKKYDTFVTGGRGKNRELWASIKGKSYDQLETIPQKAMWIRAFDEAHNPKTYRALTPEGDLGEIMIADTGKPSTVGWGSFNEIEKAVAAMESGGDFRILSDAMGGAHKVRNFFNNIEVPFSDMGDVTIDTHAIAAALMRPLAGDDKLTKQGLGLVGGTTKASGARGNYGFIADDYRDIASDRGLLPRELQSISWEGVRGLFDNKSIPNKRAVNTIWSKVDSGELTQTQALDLIESAMGGFADTTWINEPRPKRSIAGGASTMFNKGGLVTSEKEEKGFMSSGER